MKKSKIILPVIFGFIIVIVLVYITFEKYNKGPKSNQSTQTVNPVVSSELVVNDLVGPKWSWERTIISEDEIIFPRTHDAFIITFTEDGKLNGGTDCNNFSSQYKKDKNNIEFGLFLSTEMYCERSQEEVFKKSLAETEKYSFDNNGRLILESASNSIIFVDKNSEQNRKNWDLIKEAAANCDIKSGGQTHARKVIVNLKNGNKLEAYSPKIDNIFDIIDNAKEKCGEVMLWTE